MMRISNHYITHETFMVDGIIRFDVMIPTVTANKFQNHIGYRSLKVAFLNVQNFIKTPRSVQSGCETAVTDKFILVDLLSAQPPLMSYGIFHLVPVVEDIIAADRRVYLKMGEAADTVHVITNLVLLKFKLVLIVYML